MSTMASTTLVLSIAFMGVLVEWIGRDRSPGRLFFVPLGRERTARDEARARRLRLANAVVTLGGVALVLAPLGEVAALIGVIGCPLVSAGWLTAEIVGAFRSARLGRIPGRYIVSLDAAPPLSHYVSVPLELANVLVLVVPSAIFAWVLAQLPDIIPAHWNAAGEIDRYASPSELWMMAGLIGFDLLLLWGIVIAIAKERWALPENETERYAELQLERRRLMVRMIEWIMLAVNGGMAIIWLGIAIGSLPGWRDIIEATVVAGLIVTLFGVLAPLVVLMRRLLPIADQLRAIAGTDVLGTRASGWRMGGLVYYAPDDPAVFVPKRTGLGQTVNFGRPGAWVFLAVVVFAPLAISLIAMALAA